MKKLLNNRSLEKSSIVANSLMNRERNCFGGNSYEKELSFNILDFLQDRIEAEKQITWFDICCGQGKALIEASEILAHQNLNSNIKIIGIDLVGMFLPIPPEASFLQLIETSFEDFESSSKFDLITCVHGLHYIGDKLDFIQKSVSLLKADGFLIANLDLSNLKFQNEKNAGRTIANQFRNFGLEYNPRKHLLTCKGKKKVNFTLEYLGADDTAGPNYTKQAVVNSFYRN